MKRALALVTLLALTLPAVAFAQTEPRGGDEVRPVARVGAPDLGAGAEDRPDRHVDQQGRRLPDPRDDRVDRHRDRLHARPTGPRPEPPPGARRDDLRGRAGAGRRAGPSDEGDRPLVPVRRDADDLHLGDQHDRVHPAPALRRALGDRRDQHPDVRDLRGDLDALGHARARAHDVDVHARRGDPRERRGARTSRAGSPTCRRRCCR